MVLEIIGIVFIVLWCVAVLTLLWNTNSKIDNLFTLTSMTYLNQVAPETDMYPEDLFDVTGKICSHCEGKGKASVGVYEETCKYCWGTGDERKEDL